MRLVIMTSRWFVALALTSCWKTPSGTAEPPKHTTAANVEVAIASVSLADDCPEVAQAKVAASVAADQPPDACDQTAMQLSLRSSGEPATQVQIKKVELLGANHQVLGVLLQRAPTLWNESGYVAWDQTIAAGQAVKASYKLSAPNWDAVPGGRFQRGAMFYVRVTLAVGTEERTVEKQAMVRAMRDPEVMT